ncbi:hypothetical protein KKI24_18640 [bacterium]|nr:hypothetical protein [bacterium]
MKKQILDRYSRTPDNKVMIAIAAGKIEDLYHDFDKHAPYVRKELDQDLVEYIIDSVSEIGDEDFMIQFRFTTLTDKSLTFRVKSSIENYFLYLKELKYRELARLRRSFFILFFAGLLILSLSVWVNQKFTGQGGVFTLVFAEGLTVAAWVALWNAITIFLINWAPHRRQIKMYDRVAQATIQFHESSQNQQ